MRALLLLSSALRPGLEEARESGKAEWRLWCWIKGWRGDSQRGSWINASALRVSVLRPLDEERKEVIVGNAGRWCTGEGKGWEVSSPYAQ